MKLLRPSSRRRRCWQVVSRELDRGPPHLATGRRASGHRRDRRHDASRATFFARGAGGDRRELALKKLTVAVTTQPGMVRSHLVMELASTGEGQAEAVMRLPVPQRRRGNERGAVGKRPTDARRVRRTPACERYLHVDRFAAARSGAGQLGRAGWVAVSIFPLEGKQSRRFELEWVEPAAVADGQVQYRVPIVARGRPRDCPRGAGGRRAKDGQRGEGPGRHRSRQRAARDRPTRAR